MRSQVHLSEKRTKEVEEDIQQRGELHLLDQNTEQNTQYSKHS